MRCCIACFFVVCLCVFSLHVLVRFVCDALGDAVGGVRVIVYGSFV